jgi:hypothetical protein
MRSNGDQATVPSEDESGANEVSLYSYDPICLRDLVLSTHGIMVLIVGY